MVYLHPFVACDRWGKSTPYVWGPVGQAVCSLQLNAILMDTPGSIQRRLTPLCGAGMALVPAVCICLGWYILGPHCCSGIRQNLSSAKFSEVKELQWFLPLHLGFKWWNLLSFFLTIFLNLMRKSLWFFWVCSKTPFLPNTPHHFCKQSSYDFLLRTAIGAKPIYSFNHRAEKSLKIIFYTEPTPKAILFIQNSYNGLHKLVEGQQLPWKAHKYLMVRS